MSEASTPHISPERLREIREFADHDILDMVEPEEMYYFLGLEEQLESAQTALHEIIELPVGLREPGFRTRTLTIVRRALSNPANEPLDDMDSRIIGNQIPSSGVVLGTETPEAAGSATPETSSPAREPKED